MAKRIRDPVKTRAMYRAYYDRLRNIVLQKYGGKCKRCKISDSRVLCIDHVNGDGHKKKTGTNRRVGVFSTIVRLSKLPRSKDYQLLCANCNIIKARENKEFARGWRKD